LEHEAAAEEFQTTAKRGSEEWRVWRSSDQWQRWCAARAPVVAARRRALRLLGDKEAVQILFDEIGPRFADRPGGYTRVLRMAMPRLGDAGERAILEFVGVNDRVSVRSEKPQFDADEDAQGKEEPEAPPADEAAAADSSEETVADDGAQTADAPAEAGDKSASDDESASKTD
jgi:large subunit ribosomal protein L17